MALAGLSFSCESWKRSVLFLRAPAPTPTSRMAVVVAMGRRNAAAAVRNKTQSKRKSTPRRKGRVERASETESDGGGRVKEDEVDEDDEQLDEDALEALFSQLEKDLQAADERNDPYLTEKEMAALEEGLGIGSPSGLQEFIEQSEKIESERVARRIVKLEKRQILKLKAALDAKKRDIKVKALAQETGLERRDVLTFLRNPPAELLELVDSLSDSEEEVEDPPPAPEEKNEPEAVDDEPVERMGVGNPHGSGPRNWYAQKRIRKQHLDTFELVFERSKRPTGAMIQSMVDLTHVPRKRILDWFENRRREHAVSVEQHKMKCRESSKQRKEKVLESKNSKPEAPEMLQLD